MVIPLLETLWSQCSEMATSIAPNEIFVGIIGFSWATFLWEEYLSYRQRSVVESTKLVPAELRGVVDRETFDKARAYAIDKASFGLVESIYSQMLSTGIMVYGGLPWLWELAGHAVEAVGYDSASSEILQTIAFVCIGNVVTTAIGLPWSAYFTFKIEQKHGFNKQTPGFFIKDKFKKLLLSQVISVPVVSGLVYIIKAGGQYFFLYLWLFTMSVLIFFMTIYPDFIAPLFDKYEPLPEGDLKTSIEALAARINFPLTKLYVVEGSKRSAHSNAYFYGFFKNKRIVLYDTLLQDYTPLNKEDNGDKQQAHTPPKKTGCNTTEVLAVLGHELGHWKLNHVLKGIIISQVNLLLIFGVFGALNKHQPLFRAFGFNTQPAFIGLIIVMQFVFAPYNELLTFLMNMFSRHNEFEADEFAVGLGYQEELQGALIKLNKDNLGFPVHDPLYSSWHHSHPPLLQRIQSLQRHAKKD
uniref:CAAX prenyl protease n=1 Tax=Hirondellea gigas TaxID=1518452 RepID=A0A2P2I4T7_9CRUS